MDAEQRAAGGEPARPRARRPWWSWLFFFVEPPRSLTEQHWYLLGVLGATFLLNQYDMAILGLALPQIQSGLGVAEQDVGRFLAVIRLGVLPALVLALLADRQGRRRLLLLTILGFTACTTATAFARDAAQFMALQFLARAFIAAEEMVAIVVVAEELEADARGWGLGVLAAMGALGHGVAAIALGFVNLLPFGWRALYLVGIVPLLLLAWIRRGIRETRRFERGAAERGQLRGVAAALRPLQDVVRLYPGRMLALAAASFPFAFVVFTALAFVSKTLQEVHGYAPHHVSLLFIFAGVVVPVGMVISGSVADRFGRKRVMVVAFVLNLLGIAFFYNASGPLLVPAWAFMMFTFVGIDVLFGALATELFPTSYRSTASGIRALVITVAAALGLWTESLLFGPAGSHAAALTWMLPFAAIAPCVIALFVPETAARELEEIAPERRARREAPV